MAHIDIGLRYKGDWIAGEVLDGHKLRVKGGDTIYGVPLVATDHADASPMRMYDGASVKALVKVDPIVEYNAVNGYEPDNANLAYPWVRTSSFGTPYSAERIKLAVEGDVDCDNGERFKIDTSIAYYNVKNHYVHLETTPWGKHINNANGYLITARLKVIDSGTAFSQLVYWYDGVYGGGLHFADNRIYVPASMIAEAEQEYVMDTTDAYHKYEMIVEGTSLKVNVDGIERITATLNNPFELKRIYWGDAFAEVNSGGEVHWDYIKYVLN